MTTCERCGDFSDDLVDVYGAVQVCVGCCEQLGGAGFAEWVRENPEPVLRGWARGPGLIFLGSTLVATSAILGFALSLPSGSPAVLFHLFAGLWFLFSGVQGPSAHFSHKQEGRIGIGWSTQFNKRVVWLRPEAIANGRIFRHVGRVVVRRVRIRIRRSTPSGRRFLAFQELLANHH